MVAVHPVEASGRRNCSLYVLAAILVFISSLQAQSTTNSQGGHDSTAAQSSCAVRVKTAHDAGYSQAVKELESACSDRIKNVKDANFGDGFRAAYTGSSVDLHATSGKIPVYILTEDIPGEDAYRLAAAEVFNTYFVTHFVITNDKTVPVTLYIYGAGNEDSATKSYEVSFSVFATVPVQIGSTFVPINGPLELSSRGGYLTNYSQDERTQRVKEAIYAVISEADAALYPKSQQ